MLSTAIAWAVYDLTQSQLALGLIEGVQVIPLLAIGLQAGQWADRFDRRKLIQISLVGTATCSGLMALLPYDRSSVP